MKILTFELKVAVPDDVSQETIKKTLRNNLFLKQGLHFLRSRYVDGVEDKSRLEIPDGREAWEERAEEEVK